MTGKCEPDSRIPIDHFRTSTRSQEKEEGSPSPSLISSFFSNRRTFACPQAKLNLLTGTNTGNLSPEDIGIIAAMGDSLAVGPPISSLA